MKSYALAPEAKDMLLSTDNEIYYSVISIWEVSLKHSINPDNMQITPTEFRQLCLDSGFNEIPVVYHHILGLDSLTQKEGFPSHKDPFDRLLLSQSIVEQMRFLTHDSKIATFNVDNVILV